MTSLVSFIIPAYNEAENIGATLQSIQNGNFPCEYEIIVVDHNSSDDTANIARALSASVFEKQDGTISSVRNTGVSRSKGDILAFLDADVTLTQQWFEKFDGVITQLRNDPNIITGSHCNAPENGNWIERYWFNSYVQETDTTNLGTGHMLTSRVLFENI